MVKRAIRNLSRDESNERLWSSSTFRLASSPKGKRGRFRARDSSAVVLGFEERVAGHVRRTRKRPRPFLCITHTQSYTHTPASRSRTQLHARTKSTSTIDRRISSEEEEEGERKREREMERVRERKKRKSATRRTFFVTVYVVFR